MTSLKKMLYELTVDKDFVALKFLIDRPNVFHVVGATHLETWHSKFLSWLLNPTERHMLGYYPFQRFLTIVAQSADQNIDDITDIAMLNVNQFYNPEVTAEKDIHQLDVYEAEEELTVNDDKGRLDVFFKVNYRDQENVDKKLVVAIEQKVYAPVDQAQCEKYYRKIQQTYKNDKFLLVALVPSSALKDTNEQTFGSAHWTGVHYQQLVDEVLMPCLENPDLNRYAQPIIEQYVDALRMPYKGKREKLATIEEERILVRSIYARFADVFAEITRISKERDSEECQYVQTIVDDTYSDVFRTIRWVLEEESDVEELWSFTTPFQRKTWDSLVIHATYEQASVVLRGETVLELWQNSLQWIEQHHLPLRAFIEQGIILGSSERGKRYAIALQPLHVNRQTPFTEMREYTSISGETYYMELKINARSGMETMLKVLRKLGVTAYSPLLEEDVISQ